MKRLIAPLLLITLLPFNTFANESIKFAIGEWAPYVSAKKTAGSFLQDVVTEAFKLEGIDVKYDYFSWKRSYLKVLDGEYDGTFPWSKTPERIRDFHIHKIPLLEADDVYFHLKSTPFDWSTIEDLRKYRVGVTVGYDQEVVYKEMGINAEVVESEVVSFRLLLANRIDVYQTSKDVGYTTINKIFSKEEAQLFTHHTKAAIKGNGHFVLFSKKTSRGKMLSKKFDSGLKQLKTSGEYSKIITKHQNY